MTDYEKLYVEESGQGKPKAKNYTDFRRYSIELNDWKEGFILWLCNRLEKAEHSKNFYELRIKELDKYRNEVSIPEPYLTAIINILANGKYNI